MKLSLPVLALVGAALILPVHAQDTTAYKFKGGYPTPETSKQAQDDADYQRAIVAYRFWYPTVSVEGIFNGNREAGIRDNEAMGMASTGPRQVGFTLNSD